MSKSISLKVGDDIFRDVERIARRLHISRGVYINRALEFYNGLNERKWLRQQLVEESRLTRKSSVSVLEEMEKLMDPEGMAN